MTAASVGNFLRCGFQMSFCCLLRLLVLREIRKSVVDLEVHLCLVGLIRCKWFFKLLLRRRCWIFLVFWGWGELRPAQSGEIGVVFIANLRSSICDLVRDRGLLAHLKQFLSLRLNVTVHLVAIGGHWALAAQCAIDCISAGFRRLKGRPRTERVQVLILDQVGPD